MRDGRATDPTRQRPPILSRTSNVLSRARWSRKFNDEREWRLQSELAAIPIIRHVYVEFRALTAAALFRHPASHWSMFGKADKATPPIRAQDSTEATLRSATVKVSPIK